MARAASTSATEDRDQLRKALKWSIMGHVFLLFFVAVRALVFPNTTIPYVPTLRVDVVDLPEVLKKNKNRMNLPTLPVEKPKKISPPKPKSKKNDGINLRKKAKKNRRKMKNALDRIKALDRIRRESRNEIAPDVIKGNKASKGKSLSGNAKEAPEVSYPDLVHDRIQQNWALPVWLARQKYSAQVAVYIDTRGNLRRMQFTKPSGNAQFDAAVKKAIQDSAPFPAPSEDWAQRALFDGILLGFPL